MSCCASPANRPFARRFYSEIATFYLIVAILLLCIQSSEQQIQADSDMDGWFDRQLRVPKPKFIRFGRAGQKLIRFGRSSTAPNYSDELSQLDALVDAVDELYPSSPELRAFKSSPKRAQKFIRFG
ncbi:hypothetical protein GPALN_003742 [Globodera pallida]|nr:hypothetical protein GPALN_003742 [Globodera pallida]